MLYEVGAIMKARNPIERLLCGAAVAIAVLACIAPATAQDTPQTSGAGVPPAVLQGALNGTPAGIAALRAYLMSAGSEAIPRLSQNVFQALKENQDNADPQALIRAVNRVANVGTSMVAVGRVMHAAVDSSYVPPQGTVALDFGPPDKTTAKGFERTLVSDPRLQGTNMRPVRRPGDSDLLSDGIRGIEKITLNVPDGSYRIILMTQNLGESKLMESPFGREVKVNDSAVAVSDDLPQSWIDEGVLTSRGADLVTREGGAHKLVEQQDAGFLVVEAAAVNGQLVIELKGAGSSGTYLTGLIVEPQNQPSSLVLSDTASQIVKEYEQRELLQVAILERAAEVLTDISPAAGPEQPPPTPEPTFETSDVASPS